MSEEPQYLTRLASEIDKALARSDEINELQDTRVLAAAYRAEKARAERAEQVLATEHDLWVQAEANEKALRAPRGDGSGGWTLDYGYINLIAETMNQEFRVGMEEIEAVILAHEAPKDGSA